MSVFPYICLEVRSKMNGRAAMTTVRNDKKIDVDTNSNRRCVRLRMAFMHPSEMHLLSMLWLIVS